MSRRLVATLTLAAALVVTSVLAYAHDATYSRGLHASIRSSHAQGRVSSPKQACKAHSTVQLWRKVGGPDDKIASDETDSDGRWRINAPGGEFDPGNYYLLVTRKVLKDNAEHRHRCPRLESNTFSL